MCHVRILICLLDMSICSCVVKTLILKLFVAIVLLFSSTSSYTSV